MVQLLTTPAFWILFIIIFFAGFWWGCEHAERFWKAQFKNFSETTNDEYRKCLSKMKEQYKKSTI